MTTETMTLGLPQAQYDYVVEGLRKRKRVYMTFTDNDSAVFFKQAGKIMARKPNGDIRELIVLTDDILTSDFEATSMRGAMIKEFIKQGVPVHEAVAYVDDILRR